MSTRRVQKVSELIRQQISEQVKFVIPENLGLVTVTDVITTPDLRDAKIFFSCLDESNSPNVLKILEGKTKEFQRFLGRRLEMKFTPRLKFVLDKDLGQVNRIEEILESLKRKPQ